MTKAFRLAGLVVVALALLGSTARAPTLTVVRVFEYRVATHPSACSMVYVDTSKARGAVHVTRTEYADGRRRVEVAETVSEE